VKAHLYRNDGLGGPVDYSTPFATVTDPAAAFTTAAVAAPSDTTFALRFHDETTGLEERNTAALARVVVNASGVDVTRVPAAPTGVSASPLAAGKARVRWTYTLLPGQPAPTGFHVYAGTPTPDLSAPAATLPYFRDRQRYATGPAEGLAGADLAGLADETPYRVYVRAYNAAGEEQNTNAAAVTGEVNPPAAAEFVSATVVP
jgi:hypothetical protein